MTEAISIHFETASCLREIHNVVPFLSVWGSVKKCLLAIVLFSVIYKKSSKIPQKNIFKCSVFFPSSVPY